MAGELLLAAWHKLVGLLTHLVCVLMMPYHIMYDIYDISDACRRAGVQLDQPIITTAKGVKALQRWLDALRTAAGVTALAAVPPFPRTPYARPLVAASYAATSPA